MKISFDPLLATTPNVPVAGLYLMLVSAISLTVVMVMQVVGLIMVIALLTIPAAIAGQFVQDLKQMMLYSSYLGIIFTTVGLWLSYTWDLTSGATIILVSGTTYLGTLLFKACSKGLLGVATANDTVGESNLK